MAWPQFPTLLLKAQLLANKPGAWRHLKGRRLDRAANRLAHMFTGAVMSCTSSDWALAQVHPGPLTRCHVVKGVGGLSSLPVGDLRGATAEGIGAHHDLSFCLWGEIQQVSAAVLRGINVRLGATLKQTDETEDRWGEEKRQVRLNQDTWEGVNKLKRRTGYWTEMATEFHVAHILCTGGVFVF